MEAQTAIAVRHAQHRKAAVSHPVLLILRCLIIVGLVALLYLRQVGGATSSATKLQALQAEQSALQRQDAMLHQQLGRVRSPAYIDRQARALGLVPAGAGAVTTLRISGRSQP